MALDFEFEWLSAPGVRVPELRATWARLRLTLNGEPITRVIDRSAKSFRDAIYVPLYPLAEWIAANWWHLLHEPYSPDRASARSYEVRHQLRFGREGFAFPDLRIQPLGERIQIETHPESSPQFRTDFLSSLQAVVSLDAMRDFGRRVVTLVLDQLEKHRLLGTPLQQDWEAIETAAPEERDFCIAAAALGLDPYALSEIDQERLIGICDLLPPETADEFLQAADFIRIEDQLDSYRKANDLARSNPCDFAKLRQIAQNLGNPTEAAAPPWRQGYALASDLREALSAESKVFDNMGEVLGLLAPGVPDAERAVYTVDPVGLFDGLVACNPKQSPGFVLGSRSASSELFTLCRSLSEYLTSPCGSSAIVTRSASDRQRRNRAFAAEFLVPAQQLRMLNPPRQISIDRVEDIAGQYHVSPWVIRHQLLNHHIVETIHTDDADL